MNKPTLEHIPIKKLIKAKWNYKKELPDAMMYKLKRSIKDSGYGVLSVRELNGVYEIIDGNRRFDALKGLANEELMCLNYGKLLLGDAILLFCRVNGQWGKLDILKYAELMKNEVLSIMSKQSVASSTPEELWVLDYLENLLDFDWSKWTKHDKLNKKIGGFF